MENLRPRFWETVPLSKMTPDEWEALCDGCGKCCLNKLEYEDTGEVAYTRVSCRLFDDGTCRCSNYENRKAIVPECVFLSPKTLPKIAYWMPATCAYKLLFQKKPLPDWHPLLTGDPNSTHKAGMSMRGLTVSEAVVPEDDWEDYLIEETPLMRFASDNSSGAAPEIMAAVARANEGFERSYGADQAMARVTAMIREMFEAPEAAIYLVATGTTANALSIASYCPPWGAVFCHEFAHIAEDECGAPEFYSGAKLVLVGGAGGKMTPATLAGPLGRSGGGGVHGAQPAMLSLTNVTEAGTVYSVAEIAALTAMAKARGLPCHLDGARFANALVATGATPAEMTWKSGIDVLSFGGTKNGCLGVEAVVMFDPARAWEFELRRKRGGHLFSKHRFLSAQMEAYLADGLWLKLATHANAMGQRLASGLRAKGATVPDSPANMMFPEWAVGTHDRLEGAGAVYYRMPAPEGRERARLVTSWSTSEDHVDSFLSAF